MKILGITGRAGAGKTTLSTQLADLGWKRTRFSQPIKSMILQLLMYQGVDNNLAWRMLDGDLKETPTRFLSGCTPRHAMQTLGAEWRDLIHRDLWLDAWKCNIRNYPNDAKIVVDDLRFKHEEATIRNLGGKIVLIERPNNPTRLATNGHISETEIKEISPDAIILNDAAPIKMIRELQTVAGEL